MPKVIPLQGLRTAVAALATVAVCASIAVADGRQATIQTVPHALVQDDLREPTIVVDRSRGEIVLDGDFAEGTARRLRALLRANAGAKVLSLSSDGGLVDEAEQIGDIIAAHGMVTVVRTTCISACTLAYVRGRERLAQAGAKLGFHAPWIADGGEERQVASEEERQAYLAAGVTADFVTEALAVPAASIWFPDDDRLLRAQVVTAILPPEDLSARLARAVEPRRMAAAE